MTQEATVTNTVRYPDVTVAALAVLAGLSAAPNAPAGATSWNVNAGGLWRTGANWTNGTPGENDDATLGAQANNYTVTIDRDATAKTLTMNSAKASLFLDGSKLTLGLESVFKGGPVMVYGRQNAPAIASSGTFGTTIKNSTTLTLDAPVTAGDASLYIMWFKNEAAGKVVINKGKGGKRHILSLDNSGSTQVNTDTTFGSTLGNDASFVIASGATLRGSQEVFIPMFNQNAGKLVVAGSLIIDRGRFELSGGDVVDSAGDTPKPGSVQLLASELYIKPDNNSVATFSLAASGNKLISLVSDPATPTIGSKQTLYIHTGGTNSAKTQLYRVRPWIPNQDPLQPPRPGPMTKTTWTNKGTIDIVALENKPATLSVVGENQHEENTLLNEGTVIFDGKGNVTLEGTLNNQGNVAVKPGVLAKIGANDIEQTNTGKISVPKDAKLGLIAKLTNKGAGEIVGEGRIGPKKLVNDTNGKVKVMATAGIPAPDDRRVPAPTDERGFSITSPTYTLTKEGDYEQRPGAILEISINGLSPSTFEYGALAVVADPDTDESPVTMIAGTLQVVLTGYSPQVGQRLTVLTSSSPIIGAFDAVSRIGGEGIDLVPDYSNPYEVAVLITSVPTPGTFALLALGGALALPATRRRPI